MLQHLSLPIGLHIFSLSCRNLHFFTPSPRPELLDQSILKLLQAFALGCQNSKFPLAVEIYRLYTSTPGPRPELVRKLTAARWRAKCTTIEQSSELHNTW